MPAKKYIVSLTKEEQKSLEDLTKTGKAAAAKINRAKILLKADINREEGGWKDEAISIALDTSVSTIEQVRQRFVEEGLETALNPRPRTSMPKKLDGEIEAHLIAIACSNTSDSFKK
ncbi:MAG: helix-turn-helix domain-containing protein [Pseudanabaena sp.]|jgi:transposase